MLASQFNTRPLYQQVADEFIGRIVSGVWGAGQVIENEADLARSLGISLGTVRKAFDILSEYELLDRQQGKGTIIADLARSASRFGNIRDAEGTRMSGTISVHHVELALPNEADAALLGVNIRTPILRFGRRRTFQERVFMLEDVLLRVDVSARSLDAKGLEKLALARWTDHDLATTKREMLRPVACGAEEAVLFGIAPQTPVLRLERVIVSHRGRPLEARDARFHPGDDLFYVCH